MSDFVEVFGEWLVDGTLIEAPSAEVGIEGSGFAAPVTADGIMIEMKTRIVRNPSGVETTATRTLYVPNGHAQHASFVPGARVTFADGYKSHVIVVQDFGAFGVVDHLVVACE